MPSRLALLVISIVPAATVLLASAQDPFRGELYRGPLILSSDAAFVEPANGVPLDFSKSVLESGYRLRTFIRSKSVRTIPVSAITLRLAFGPTAHGMVTFRMRAIDRAPEPPVVIAPGTRSMQPPIPVLFEIVPEDPQPGALALRPGSKVVFTVEHIDSSGGPPLFENPDATELLWEALGRPSLSLH